MGCNGSKKGAQKPNTKRKRPTLTRGNTGTSNEGTAQLTIISKKSWEAKSLLPESGYEDLIQAVISKQNTKVKQTLEKYRVPVKEVKGKKD